MYQHNDREKTQFYISTHQFANKDVISETYPKCQSFQRDFY
ncbi:unnamed protein product [Paramecium sonneborni]|uniref:Uncharacterized protein n=1 Tax=Paramecium sonneborni TaxID=65129 RepID=A0A8S1K9H3_9CILI|nr:unnamed protein product [Paramecium sonneborni]